MNKTDKTNNPSDKVKKRRSKTGSFAALLALMCVSSVAVYGAASTDKEKVRFLGEAVFTSSGSGAVSDAMAATPVGASVAVTDVDAMAEAYIEGEFDINVFFEDIMIGVPGR